jgi:hypothetical protein
MNKLYSPSQIEHNTAMLLYGNQNQNPIRRAMSLETFPQQQTTVGLDELEVRQKIGNRNSKKYI